MDRFEAMRIFVCVADRASFTQAADSLGVSKATVSGGVQYLEAHVGVRLFHRTTRTVQLTQDGMALYDRCISLLADVEELETTFQFTTQPIQGRLRVDMPARLAHNVMIPRLPEFLDEHPGIVLELSCTDRRVDVVSEGFDCVLRIGNLPDSTLIARPLGTFRMVNCASPAYIERYGIPKKLTELGKHRMIHYASNFTGKPDGFEYFDGQYFQEFEMQGSLTVNNADAYEAACLAGLGIIQAPDIGMRAHIQSGRLIAVLPKYQAEAMPVNLIYANRKHLSKRVQVFMAWVETVLAPYTAPMNTP
jgi:DNA-binding transcriptional LysR family regulator